MQDNLVNQSFRKPHNIAVGSIISLISYLCVALMAAAVKLIPHTVNITVIVFFQYFIAFVLCLPSVFFKDGLGSLKTQKFTAHLFRDVVGLITFGLFFLALLHITVLKAVVLRSTTPFWIPLLLFFWRRDRISSGLWFAIVIGFIGVLFIVKPGTHGYLNVGTLYALGSGLVMGISAIMIRRLSVTEPAKRILFYYFLVASLITFPFALYNWRPMSLNTGLLLIGIGILMYIIQYTLCLAFQYAKASVLAPISYSAILFSGILDWLIWQVHPDFYEYLGIILVICSGIFAIVIERRKEFKNNLNGKYKNE